jgi:hypothetical protein
MRYVIKTQSTFENVYVIDAPSEEAAKDKVRDNIDPPDFLQKHLGENIIEVTVSTSKKRDTTVRKITKQGYT